MAPLLVGILIFDEVEVLDFCGPFEVFSVASSPQGPTPDFFHVQLVAERPEAVRTRGGMRVLPDWTLDELPALDLLLVPGGPGTRRDILNRRLIAWLAAVQPRVALASVCTGALLLAEAGRLDGLPATTHGGSHAWLREYPAIRLRPEARFVDNGAILTSAGVSAGIDMALHLVERLAGAESAAYAERIMEFPRQRLGEG